MTLCDPQPLLDSFISKGGVGIQLSFAIHGQPIRTFVSGLADRSTGARVDPDHLFKIGSCTKVFVASAMMVLAAQGKVNLDDAIAAWFPDRPYAADIRVIDLINHRSGLPEFEHDIPMQGLIGWTPERLLDFAYEVSSPKPPHNDATYNNTGYVMAGLLIEAVTGQRLGGALRNLVLDPLGLRDSWSPSSEVFPVSRMVRGSYLRTPEIVARGRFAEGGEMWNMEGILPAIPQLQDSSNLFPFSLAYACGDMVATTADQVRMMTGLFGSDLLAPDQLMRMTQNRTPVSFPGTRMNEAGAGVFASTYGGRSVLGHQGSIPGYVSVMQYDPETRLSVALSSNLGSGDRLSFAAAGIHPLLDEILGMVIGQPAIS